MMIQQKNRTYKVRQNYEAKNLPASLKTIGFKGGNPEKEKAIYKKLRKYVKDEWKDELCPNPDTFQPPVRKHQVCLDWL